MKGVLQLWLLATAVFLAGVLIWSFAPVLVPMLGVTIVIGGFVAIIVPFARWIERRRAAGRRP